MRLKLSYARSVFLLACLTLVACSNEPKTANESNSPSPTTSSTPDADPLKIPERVASGTVTELRGTWSSAVQSIDYLSAADNSRQPMMFYKPQRDEPRPLLVALHSWSNDYRQQESVIYSEWCIANEAQVPASLRSETTDLSSGGLKILFRRQSGNARITVFDGAHDKNTEAAFRWLNQQRKGRR